MPLTNEKVIQAHEALVVLVKNDKEEKYAIPKDVRLILAENLNDTIPVITEYGNQHNALVAKNSTGKDAQGNFVINPGTENVKVFNMEKQDLLNQPSGVESFREIRYADLPEGLSIDLLALLLRTGMLVA